MENRLQATFMPRQSAVPGGGAYVRAKNPTNFLMVIGAILFILVIVAFAGLYVYKGYLQSSNEAKKTTVEEAIENFEPELTRELSTLKSRIDIGKQLLSNHSAFSLLFSLMETNTTQSVRFTGLTYTVGPDQKIQLTMKGEARSYNAIAYQSDVFSKLEPLKNPIFSNLSLTDSGTITFSVTAELDPASITYKKLIGDVTPPPSRSVTTSAATGTPTTTRTDSGTSTSTSTSTPR